MQNYAVIGLSTFSENVALRLAEAGQQVIIIDRSKEVIERMAPLVTRAVIADAMNYDVLEAHGVLAVEAVFIGLKDHFDFTVLLSQYLVEKKVNRIIAQVDSVEKEQALIKIGVHDPVFPERDFAERVIQRQLWPNLLDFVPFGDDQSVVEMVCTPSMIGKNLIELDIRRVYDIQVIGRRRGAGNQVKPLQPGRMLKEGDVLVLVGENKKIDRFSKAMVGV